MAQNQNGGFGAGGGGFLHVLGIIYLIKIIRRRREERRLAQAQAGGTGLEPPNSPPQ